MGLKRALNKFIFQVVVARRDGRPGPLKRWFDEDLGSRPFQCLRLDLVPQLLTWFVLLGDLISWFIPP